MAKNVGGGAGKAFTLHDAQAASPTASGTSFGKPLKTARIQPIPLKS
jgi:hypothetical protein